MGSGSDGGIDCIYVFCNGDLVREDFDCSLNRKSVSLEVFVIQTKTTPTYGEEPISKLIAATSDLFNLSHKLTDFHQVYNESVLGAVGIFRNVFNSLASRFPALTFNYIYASRGDSGQIHPNVSRKADLLRDTISGLFSAANYKFLFVGAEMRTTIEAQRRWTNL